MGDEREMGRLEAKVDLLLQRWDRFEERMQETYVPRNELQTWFNRITSLEQEPHSRAHLLFNGFSTVAFIMSAIEGLALLFKHN